MSDLSPAEPAVIGGLALPLEPDARPDRFPNPTCIHLAAFLEAYLNRYLGLAWAQVSRTPVVNASFPHDPTEYDFNVEHLPALYVFSEGSAGPAVPLDGDRLAHMGKIRIFWLLPNERDLEMAELSQAVSMVGETIEQALHKGRDPSYVTEADRLASEAASPTQLSLWAVRDGSTLVRAMGVDSLTVSEWRLARVQISPPGTMPEIDAPHGVFRGLQLQVTYQKSSSLNSGGTVPEALGPQLPGPWPATLKTTLAVVTPDEADYAAGGDEFPAV